ncbi:MAG: TetR/AcrR family transcriptional regulator [Reyranellaceae bacterium]
MVPFPTGERAEDLRRRRMAPSDRRSMILEQAAEFFASNGPAASTRALAKALGITQALLYRYFPSKEALVRAVYQERFGQRWNPAWSELLRDRARPLAERLEIFFISYIDRLGPADYRLWMRAALEGWSFAGLYHRDLVEHVLTPIAGELRHEAGLPELRQRPACYGEMELIGNLHGALTFLRIRRDIYGAPVHPDTAALVRLNVAIFLPGALQQMRALHQPDAPASLTGPPLSV